MTLARNLTELLQSATSQRRIGAFELVEQLGRGGFAPVWLARETYEEVTLRAVAVKLFDVSSSGDADEPRVLRSSIVGEAAALCRVEHPNVVRFHTLAIDEARGVIGLVMEYADGRALSSRIEKDRVLAFDDTLAAGIAVASALAAVHRVGLVHRDVKPQNVIEVGARYKLIDFGIAAAERADSGPVPAYNPVVLDDLPRDTRRAKMSTVLEAGNSRHAQVSGTVGYVDPYVIQTGAPSTAASDIYALGAMLFECATGLLPSEATPQSPGIRGDVLDGRAAAPSLRLVRPELPIRFATLVDAMLHPRPEARPSSAEEVSRELEHVRVEWELARSSRRLQLLSGEVLAAIHGALAEAERRAASSEYAAAVDVYAVSVRDLLAGPLAGAGHEVAGALLLAARVRLAEADHPAIAQEVGALLKALLAAHSQLLASEPVTLSRTSRYHRDDPISAPRLLDVLTCAYLVGVRLEDDGAAQKVDLARYVPLFAFELALELFTRLRAEGRCPGTVHRLQWLVETRFTAPEGVRAWSILTSVLRELRGQAGKDEPLLPAPARAAVDSAIDAAIDSLALGGRATVAGDLEGAIAEYESCARRIAGLTSKEDVLRSLTQMLEAELAEVPVAESRRAASHAVRRGLLRIVSQRWWGRTQG